MDELLSIPGVTPVIIAMAAVILLICSVMLVIGVARDLGHEARIRKRLDGTRYYNKKGRHGR